MYDDGEIPPVEDSPGHVLVLFVIAAVVVFAGSAAALWVVQQAIG